MLLLCILFSNIHQPLFGQEKINLFAGYGPVELFHIGARYSFPQTQLGSSAGTNSDPDFRKTTFSGDALFHIGGTSELSARRPWYLKVGFTHTKQKIEIYRSSYIYFNPRIGRELNLSKKFGLQLDAGVAIDLAAKPSGTGSFGPGFPIFPNFGTDLFYNLY